eukprot:337921_1
MQPLPISFDTNDEDIHRYDVYWHYHQDYHLLDLCSPPTPQIKPDTGEIITLILDAPMYGSSDTFNELLSFVVPNINEQQAMNKLNDLLLSYWDEIDFELDLSNNQITNGIVFINNCHCIYFSIHVCRNSDNSIIIEFIRPSGDALSSAKFFGDIKSKFIGDVRSECLINLSNVDTLYPEKCMLFINGYIRCMQQFLPTEIIRMCFDYYFVPFAMEPLNENVEMEPNQGMTALICDESITDLLNENVDNYLYRKVIENKAINLSNRKEVLDYKKLCIILMHKSSILHSDISVVRASLLILNKFVNVYYELFQNNKQLISTLNHVLQNNKCKIIKRHVAKLLSEIRVNKKRAKQYLMSVNISIIDSTNQYATKKESICVLISLHEIVIDGEILILKFILLLKKKKKLQLKNHRMKTKIH